MKRTISLLLTLVCLVSVLVSCAERPDAGSTTEKPSPDNSITTDSYTPDPLYDNGTLLVKASYPKMAQYPNDQSTNFNAEYDAWRADKLAQLNQADGYKDGLNPFFISSIKEYLSGADKKNRVYSPVNVFMALSMLAEITDGNSRAQILSLLGADSIDAMRSKASAVWNANYCDDGALTSILANSLWLNENFTFNQNTVNTLAEKYYASSFKGVMGSDEFNKAIQGWLNEQTGGLLKKQTEGIEFDPATILALASTVYFKAKWHAGFSKNSTKDGIFHAVESDITCKFMHKSDVRSYYSGDKYSAVALGFEDGGNMWLILPDKGVSVDALLSDDKTYDLFLPTGTEVASKSLIVNMSVPQFDVVSDMDLSDGLKKLGVTDVFDAGASDFTPIVTENAVISEVEHAARVMIDEEGCVAAAFTVVMVESGAAMSDKEVDFILDRPFVFVITGEDGLPMFTGVVNQPK